VQNTTLGAAGATLSGTNDELVRGGNDDPTAAHPWNLAGQAICEG